MLVNRTYKFNMKREGGQISATEPTEILREKLKELCVLCG